MTWHDIMTYAHQGVEAKEIPGVEPASLSPSARRSPAMPRKSPSARSIRRSSPRRGVDILLRVERLMEDVSRTLPASAAQPATNARAAAPSARPWRQRLIQRLLRQPAATDGLRGCPLQRIIRAAASSER